MISIFASELAFRNSANAVIFSCSEVRICADPMLNKIFFTQSRRLLCALFVSGVCTGAGRVPCTAGSSFLRTQLSEPALRVRRRLPDAISCSSCRSGSKARQRIELPVEVPSLLRIILVRKHVGVQLHTEQYAVRETELMKTETKKRVNLTNYFMEESTTENSEATDGRPWLRTKL